MQTPFQGVKESAMTLTVVLVLLLIAAIIFGLDFLLGFTGVEYGRWRVQSLAWFLVVLALLLWHGGK
jgi:hypothetical protein